MKWRELDFRALSLSITVRDWKIIVEEKEKLNFMTKFQMKLCVSGSEDRSWILLTSKVRLDKYVIVIYVNN